MGFLEVVGVASILPFMQLLAEPEVVESNKWLRKAYDFFAFESERQLLIASGALVLLLIMVSNVFSAFTIWLQYKFTWQTAHNLSIRLLQTYIEKPYQYYLNVNTAELRTYLITEVGRLASGILIPIIEMTSRFMVAIVIIILLLAVNPTIALTSSVVLGGLYGIIYLLQQKYVKRLGENRIIYNAKRYRSLYELLSGIKTVKAYEAQDFFYHRYEKSSRKYVDILPRFNIMMLTPRYVLEIFAFGGILSITLYLYISSGEIVSALPILSLYALAGYRLLPALQKAFAAAIKLKHNYPVLDKLYNDLLIGLKYNRTIKHIEEIPFQKSLKLANITFQYENSTQPILRDFSVEIRRGQTVAFVGSTGSGKTTIIDLLVGLLEGQQGSISIDGKPLLREDLVFWHHQIAYVPQDVFLFDDTIARNIGFGLEMESIDQSQLHQATKMADIYDFIQTLPQKFNTKIGERGVRLSGGQRQRLGLARALYKNPKVLVLDEATSALDNITEKGIIASLDTLPDDLTIIIVAHRLSTVKYANCIYFLEEGKIVNQGTYEDLMRSSETFREMVKLS